jgi:hypothetical protein
MATKRLIFYVHNIWERTVLLVIESGLSVVDRVSYAVPARGFCLFGLNMYAWMESNIGKTGINWET